MSYTERAIQALILHEWEDAKEWAAALTAMSDLTDGQLDECLRRAIGSASETAHGSRRPRTAKKPVRSG
ncbi:MAG: hypothetical protein H6905_06110 [Hyphomicrobiales bacterium]|nr:hypothetical protein [Hyphomicrobiales bacterium]